MIKKRNLDGALIQWIMTQTGLGPMVGDIRYVAPAVSSTSQFRSQLNDMGVDNIETSIDTALGKTTDYRNDIVLIAPGTYAESVADNLLNLHLLGCGGSPDAVILAPTAAQGLLVGADETAAATMTGSTIKNMTFLTPSTSNTTYAALGIAYMIQSIIEDCKFKGTTNTGFAADATIGLQIGNRTATSWEFHEHCRISRCEFTSNGGRTTELGYGILVGCQPATNPSHRGFKSMIIEDCIISAYDTGILLNTGSSSCNGTVLRRNIITNQQGGNGPDKGIVSGSDDGTDALCMLVDNKITAIADCIENFSACNCQNNIVSAGGATPDTEYHDGS